MKVILNTRKLDRYGIFASLACAVHCAALPFLLTSLPLLGLGFLASSWVEITIICISVFLGFYTLIKAYCLHRRILPLIVLLCGFVLIGSGHFLRENFEAILIPSGGLIIALAHLLNWKLSKACNHA